MQTMTTATKANPDPMNNPGAVALSDVFESLGNLEDRVFGLIDDIGRILSPEREEDSVPTCADPEKPKADMTIDLQRVSRRIYGISERIQSARDRVEL
jgi:hypothetical protein